MEDIGIITNCPEYLWKGKMVGREREIREQSSLLAF